MDLGCPTLQQWMEIWESSRVGNKKKFRDELKRFYIACAESDLLNADEFIAGEICSWVAGPNRKVFSELLSWHPLRGALTSSEQHLLRQELSTRRDTDSLIRWYVRLLLWIISETLKRPSQILEISNDGLIHYGDKANRQSFLRIPKAKKQLGRPPELWPITEELAAELERYNESPKVGKLQIQTNRLLVRGGDRQAYPVYKNQNDINKWVRQREIISPRTEKIMKITPYRVRHSGATSMAFMGISREELQYILEHDNPNSCAVYIDLIGSDLCPAFERADRKLGSIFTHLANEFFAGRIEKKLNEKLILIPTIEAPAVVGACGFNGQCNKHPFFKCYDGCPYFIAWRDADHRKALNYVESELKRWDAINGVQERSKAIKDFERLYSAIAQVIELVEQGSGRHA